MKKLMKYGYTKSRSEGKEEVREGVKEGKNSKGERRRRGECLLRSLSNCELLKQSVFHHYDYDFSQLEQESYLLLMLLLPHLNNDIQLVSLSLPFAIILL